MEKISQNIPSTANIERGPGGEWILTIKVALPVQMNMWLNSCQNIENPAFQDREYAQTMIAKEKITPLSPRINTPVRKPIQSPPVPKTSGYEPPNRMQRHNVAPPAQGKGMCM